MVELLCQAEMAVDELIDVAGRINGSQGDEIAFM
jgi:hypothetical protein